MRFVYVVMILGACGGSGSDTKTPDAPDNPDIDAAIDAPPGMVTCAFNEAADATNINTPGAEATNVMFSGTKTGICGQINNGHFANMSVDIDAYKFATAADADLLINLTGNVGALTRVVVQVGTTGGQSRNVALFEGDHATASVRLPAGEHIVAVGAFNGTDIAAPIPYTITLVPDAPATRCAKVTAAANFTEANDGATNNGNDMISVDDGASPPTRLTVSPADNPEPTALTLASGTNYRITGSSAAVDPADSYEDRDTFLFTTGATTTQLSVRLNWTSTSADFDYRVFPPASTLSVTGALTTGLVEDEFQTFAVKPNTMYWLWVGAYDGATGQPTAYDATLCPETFAP